MKSKSTLADITLADTIPMQGCLECLESLKSLAPISSETFFIHTCELRGLNYLLVLDPTNICFYHESEEALEYMKLMVELIGISNSHEDVISRVYSRSIEKFLKEPQLIQSFSQLTQKKDVLEYLNKNRFLNEYNQWTYLDRPKDPTIKKNTSDLLSDEGKKRYEKFLVPHQPGLVHFQKSKCRRLLPCWPLKEKIPFSTITTLAENAFGELEPNTNVFFCGYGWLDNKETFNVIKQKLSQANLEFYQADFFEDPFQERLVHAQTSTVYCGRLDADFPEEFRATTEHLQKRVNESDGSIHLITAKGQHKILASK